MHCPGTTFAMVYFPDDYSGHKVAHVQIRESSHKSMRADKFVLCSSQFMIKMMIDLKVTPAVLRCSTTLLSQNIETLLLNGQVSNVIRTMQPVVGRSNKF